jgi:hypothetical protein
MQAEVRGRSRTTRPPFPESWPYPGKFCGKALPVALRGTIRQPILPHFREQPGPCKINYPELQASGPWRGLPAPLWHIALPPPVGLKVSHFLRIGKDGPVSRRVGGGVARGNNAAAMCAEEKFSKIKNIISLKEPAGRGETGTPGGQAGRRTPHGYQPHKFPGGGHAAARRVCVKRLP